MKSRLKVNRSKRSSKLTCGKMLKSVRKSRRITSKKSKLLKNIKGGAKKKGKGKTEEPKKEGPSGASGANNGSSVASKKKKKSGAKKRGPSGASRANNGSIVASKKKKKSGAKKRGPIGASRANNGSSGANSGARKANNGASGVNSGARENTYFILSNLNEGEENYRPKFVYKYKHPPSDAEKGKYFGSGKIQKIFGKKEEIIIRGNRRTFNKSIFLRVNDGITNSFYIANYEEIPLIDKLSLSLEKLDSTDSWDYHISQLNESQYKQIYHINVPQLVPTAKNFNRNLRGNKVNGSPNRPVGQPSNGNTETMANMMRRTEEERKAAEAANLERRRQEFERAARGNLMTFVESVKVSPNEYLKNLIQTPGVLDSLTNQGTRINKFGLKKGEDGFKAVSQQIIKKENGTEEKLFNNFITDPSNINSWNSLNSLLSTLRSFRDKKVNERLKLKNGQIKEYFYTYENGSKEITLNIITEGYIPFIDNSIQKGVTTHNNSKNIIIKSEAIISSFKKILKSEYIHNILNNEDYIETYQFKGLDRLLNEDMPVFSNDPQRYVSDPGLIRYMLNFVAFDIVLRLLNLNRPRSIEIQFNERKGFQDLYSQSSIFRNIEYLNDNLHNHVGLIKKPYINNLKSEGSDVPDKYKFLSGPYDYEHLKTIPTVYNTKTDTFIKDTELNNLKGNLTIKVYCNIRPTLKFNEVNLGFKYFIADIFKKYGDNLTKMSLRQINDYLGSIDGMQFTFDLSDILELANKIKIYDNILVQKKINQIKNLMDYRFKIPKDEDTTIYNELNNKIKEINKFKSKVFGKQRIRHDLPINFYEPLLDLLEYLKNMINFSGKYNNNNTIKFSNEHLEAGPRDTIIKKLIQLISVERVENRKTTLKNKKQDIIEILKKIYEFQRIFNNIKNGIENDLLQNNDVVLGESQNILNCLALFEIPRENINTFNLEQIKTKLKSLLLKHHPDKIGGKIKNINRCVDNLIALKNDDSVKLNNNTKRCLEGLNIEPEHIINLSKDDLERKRKAIIEKINSERIPIKTIEDCFEDLTIFIDSRKEGVQTRIYPIAYDYYHYKNYQLESHNLEAPETNTLPLETPAPEVGVPVPGSEPTGESYNWSDNEE